LFFVSIAARLDDTTHLIAAVAFVLTGPLVGVELGVAAFTNPLVSELPDDAYRVFRSGGSRLLGALMPFWYIGTLVVLIAAAVATRQVPAVLAVALMGAAVLLSVTVLVPINNRIGAWRTGDDVDRELAGRWDRLHRVRVGLLAAMLVALTVGVVG
jgi:anthrone oxygenase-like protein